MDKEKELRKKKELWSQVTITEVVTEVDEQRKTGPVTGLDVYWTDDLEKVFINGL